MNIKEKEVTRLTFDIPNSIHRRIKSKAALKGETMRSILIKCLVYYLNREEANAS